MAHRLALIMITRSYRSAVSDALGVIAGEPPLDLQLSAALALHDWKNGRENSILTSVSVVDSDGRRRVKKEVMERWQRRWERAPHGRYTYRIIPMVSRDLKVCSSDATQLLTGHGNFRGYLFGRKRVEDPFCPYCHAVDDAFHRLGDCKRALELTGLGGSILERVPDIVLWCKENPSKVKSLVKFE